MRVKLQCCSMLTPKTCSIKTWRKKTCGDDFYYVSTIEKNTPDHVCPPSYYCSSFLRNSSGSPSLSYAVQLTIARSEVKVVVESGHGYKGSGAVLFNDILDIVGRSKGFLEDQQVVGDRLSNTDNVRKDSGKVQESYWHQVIENTRLGQMQQIEHLALSSPDTKSAKKKKKKNAYHF